MALVSETWRMPRASTIAPGASPLAAAVRLAGTAVFYEKQFPLKSHPHSLEMAKAAVFAGIKGRYWEASRRLHRVATPGRGVHI